jgi:hypothetical protein
LGIPGNRPWFTLHDRPGSNGLPVDGLVAPGVAAPAKAIGPEPKIAQVTPAIVATRLSEDFIFCKPPCVARSGITVGDSGHEQLCSVSRRLVC